MFGQAAGDYRSNVNTTGDWTNLTSWQRWNGSSWIQPTVGQGYPGQIAGTGAVLIQAGDVIIANSDIINSIGVLTISGQLTLRLEISNYINTLSVVVTPTMGSILFGKKSDFNLPENASLQVGENGLTATNQGCTNDNSVFIGTIRYANCNGTGNSDTGLIFENIMDGGGTLNAVAASNSPVCQGSTINLFGSYTGATGSGIIYSWSITNPSNLVTTTSTQNPTISNALFGTYTAKLTCTTTYNGNTYFNTETITVTVKPLSNTPTIGTITQPTCTLSTGSVVLNGLPATGTWTLTRSGTSSETTTGSGTSTTISGLAFGTYTYTVSNGSCTSAASSAVTIINPDKVWNGSVSTDWNTAANWTPSGVPTSSNCVTIPSTTRSPIISGTNSVAYANNLTILNSGALTVKSSNTLTVTDFVDVDSGFLNFENTASLVQINNVTTKANSGYIDYQRITTARKTDYTYWSSPVSPMTLGELYPDGGTFYSYEVTTAGEDWSFFDADTDMVAGKGYIANQGAEIPSAGSPPSNQLDVTFTGVPNNGHYEINNVIADRSYLLGNPYPSALDADEFLTDNAAVLSGTIYFWTHNTVIQDATNITNGSAGSGAFAYTSDDYATYNITGGVGIDSDATTGPATSPGSNKSTPTGKIASGQGFFASTKVGIPATSKIVYDNTMRVGVNGITGNNSQFFKTKNPNGKTANTKVIEKNRIWLNLTNTQGAFKQTLVGYITGATNEYDDRFDGESFDGNEFIDFYSLNQDANLVIQGRALPFDENDEVPLGYRTTINGDFTINIAQVDGLLANQAVFLEDKVTNTVTDLKRGNYTFNTAEGTFNDRFVLKYTNKTLSLDTTDKEDGILAFYSNNYKTLIIKNNLAEATVNSVALFNMLGQKIENWDVSESEQTDVQIPIKNMSSGIYVVKIKTTKGESSKKIIVN
ncbi:T9SS type A sorting domain-containing protein [Flavobacterium sp.]|uniref:T9SS type A sorting domain-containing protein n=1 Tax=Flavobacterium sp. TaxID=239 RepID=UPI0025BB469B|nr:T9SS type A sorting domain-containing protein [Flavobacterium sp.]